MSLPASVLCYRRRLWPRLIRVPAASAVSAPRALLLAALVAFCGFWATASLWFPFGWDHGIMATAGDVILAGGMPYRDAWDIKGPLAHLWFAAAQWLFGRGQAGIRVLDLALVIWASIVLARTSSKLIRPGVGAWLGMALILCHSSRPFFYTAQPDGAVSHSLVIAFAPLLTRPNRRHVVIAALVIGACALAKPLYLAFFWLPLLAAMEIPGQGTRERVGLIAAILAAVALPIVLAFAWFAWRGALDDLYEVLFRYNALEYSGAMQLAVRTRLRGYAEYFWSGARGPALAFAVFGAVVVWQRSRRLGILLIGWLLTSLAIVGLQGKFYVYQWTVIFPPIILLVAIAFDALTNAPAVLDVKYRTALKALGIAGAVAIAGPLTIQPGIDITNWARYMAGVETAPQYYGTFRLGQYSAADQMAAADYINHHTSPTDRVAIFGYESPIVYLSGRKNATRFNYALPFVGLQSSQAARDRYRREFMEAIASEPEPEFIVVGMLLLGGNRSIEVFPEFAEFLGRGYYLERSFGVVDLYRRNR
jgi:hypothetical protein